MASDKTKHVFISYVREDSDRVDNLCSSLESAGIPYWRDRTSLAPGDAWRQKIREAIQSGALVFLACFSENSVAKDKSYMNEELTLAAEEFRLRPPDRPWLLPIRFDEVEIPYWDLGAGRSINDYNRSDLFGGNYGPHLVALIQQINGLLGKPDSAVTDAREAIARASSQERPRRFQELTKNLLLDPSRRIELDDIVNQETRRVLAELSDTEKFPITGSTGDSEALLIEFVGQAQRTWGLVEPLCWSLQVAARYADSDALTPWVSAMRSIASFGEKPEGGLTTPIHLRRLPALCLAETVAVAAVAAERWSNLRSLLIGPRISINGYSDRRSLVDVIAQYRPFETSDIVAHVLAHASSEPDAGIPAAVEASRKVKLHTPVSDWMFRSLKPIFEHQFSDETEYADAFDRAECFLGALEQFENIAMSEKHDRYLSRASWYGRSTWRLRGSRSPLDDMLDEAQSEGADWGPLRAKLFDGSSDAAIRAIETYKESYDEVRGRRW
ncbi:toll/interleukin-1 receptor domain-containing protein [Gordonia sp. NPDC003422]